MAASPSRTSPTPRAQPAGAPATASDTAMTTVAIATMLVGTLPGRSSATT
ncbi:hypothetical protein ACFQGX_05800 [Nonomuraea dietziae]